MLRLLSLLIAAPFSLVIHELYHLESKRALCLRRGTLPTNSGKKKQKKKTRLQRKISAIRNVNLTCSQIPPLR